MGFKEFQWAVNNYLKKFPIKVFLFRKFQNGLSIEVTKARYYMEVISLEEGRIDRQYTILKRGREYLKIPYISQQFHQIVNGTPVIYLLEVDRINYFPMMVVDGRFKVVNINYDEKGDEISREEKPFFDSNITLSDGRVVEIPHLVSSRTYEALNWQSAENTTNAMVYKVQSFWSKYKDMIILGMLFVIVVIGVTYTTNSMNDIAKANAEAMKSIASSISQQAEATNNLTRIWLNKTGGV